MPVPRFWRSFPSRYNLIGTKCKSCSTPYFPPRKICPKCRRHGAMEEVQFAGAGQVLTWTAVHQAPAGWERQAPYTLAIVQLDEGPKLTTQLVGLEKEPEAGMRVKAVFRKMAEEGPEGVIYYGYKFAPA